VQHNELIYGLPRFARAIWLFGSEDKTAIIYPAYGVHFALALMTIARRVPIRLTAYDSLSRYRIFLATV
jgi:hypothetical protein